MLNVYTFHPVPLPLTSSRDHSSFKHDGRVQAAKKTVQHHAWTLNVTRANLADTWQALGAKLTRTDEM